jgi:hypothetical protein
VLAFNIQALGEDIIEVAEYAKTMSADDVNEVIDYILAEVSLSVSYHDRTTPDASINSTGMTLLVSSCIQEPTPVLTISQNFPRRVLETCRLYEYDKELRNDPVEFQRVYEELKIEAALIMVVSLKPILTAHVGL